MPKEPVNILQCPDCSHTFARRRNYDDHKCKADYKFKCQFCDKKFITQASLWTHRSFYHKKAIIDEKQKMLSERRQIQFTALNTQILEDDPCDLMLPIEEDVQPHIEQIVVDMETTGLIGTQSRKGGVEIIQMAIFAFDNEDNFQLMMNKKYRPYNESTASACKTHGYYKDSLKKFRRFKSQDAERIINYFKKAKRIVMFNSECDLKFLGEQFERVWTSSYALNEFKSRIEDVQMMVSLFHSDSKNTFRSGTLGSNAKFFLGSSIDRYNLHDAAEDCKVTGLLYNEIKNLSHVDENEDEGESQDNQL